MSVNQLTRLIDNDRGNVLVTAMLLIFASSIIAATVVLLSSTDLKISSNQGQETEAFFVTEAGLNEALHRISLADPTTVTVGGNTFNAAIADSKPYDPDWKVHIMLSNQSPSSNGSVTTVGTLQDLSGDYLSYTDPSSTNEAITIEHKWEDRNGDGTRDADELVLYDPALNPPENFDTGNVIDIVTVTGRAGQAERVLQAEVAKQTITARAMGALYSDKAVEISGNAAFCGWNHDMTMPQGTRPNACFAYHLGDGHLPGVTTTGDNVNTKGNSHDIEGSPAVTDTDPANPWYTLAEMLGLTQQAVDEILANADNTSIVNPLDGVTYINGDVTINADITGTGLVYITGDANINGGFQYVGLIYIEGDLQFTGNPDIMGSICVKGTADYKFTAGSAGILFSAEAIEQALAQLAPPIVLSWRDL